MRFFAHFLTRNRGQTLRPWVMSCLPMLPSPTAGSTAKSNALRGSAPSLHTLLPLPLSSTGDGAAQIYKEGRAIKATSRDKTYLFGHQGASLSNKFTIFSTPLATDQFRRNSDSTCIPFRTALIARREFRCLSNGCLQSKATVDPNASILAS